MYSCTTFGVDVMVKPQFLMEQSSPEQSNFAWMYEVQVHNNSEMTLQLLHRHWLIIDNAGQRETVDGPGVVGEQPILRPGERFGYHSGCRLTRPSGIMQGWYDMQTEDGDMKRIEIPAFSLDSPFDMYRLN